MTKLNQIYLKKIAESLGIRISQVEKTYELLESGATVPFISRYRKEMTGSLDEVQIGKIREEVENFKEVDKRRESIIAAIEKQDKLTDELKKRLETTYDLATLEDIYLPYKQKRKTRAVKAKEKGLEPLAMSILLQPKIDIELKAEEFLTDDVESVEEALQGARDIIAEMVNEDERARNKTRRFFSREAVLYSKVVKKKEEEAIKYKDYFDFAEKLSRIPSHRLLAIKRGVNEGFLTMSIKPDAEDVIESLDRIFVRSHNECGEQISMAVEDSYKRLLQPSIETEFTNLAKEKADEEAIAVFSKNLRQLLLASPLGQKRVLALDPGYRTGCKVICLNEFGDLLTNATIYPHPPQQQVMESVKKISNLVQAYNIEAIAIGNGTASRETEDFIRNKMRFDRDLQVFIVNESGASIYSASKIARDEFPEYDVTVRGAVSIGRRLMDPLAELVKIDPKSIGVGQYQHDVDQTKLQNELSTVVESCVNSVGIDLNTASKHLLTYVSGLGPQLAQNIVDYRSENGAFTKRSELKKVKRMGEKAFEQSAGFLRIRDAKNILDNTSVHPERYNLVKTMAKDLGCTVDDLVAKKELRQKINLKSYVTDEVGLPTLTDIISELEKPGRDPRSKAKAFEFSKDVFKPEDLQIGMVLPGIVTNVTNFGAFVDVGVKQDGLVHISQMADRYISNPADVVELNQHVMVKVTEVDMTRKRIALSMKL